MSLVNIPSPCPMKIAGMKPVDSGFYCGSCAKVVVDFRSKTDEEIIDYFDAHKGQKTCGIFLPTQATTSVTRSASVVRFLAALLLAFGAMLFTACGNKEPIHTTGDSIRQPDSREALELRAKQIADSTRVADSLSELNLDGMIAPHDSK